MKRILTCLLILSMTLTLLPAGVLAEDTAEISTPQTEASLPTAELPAESDDPAALPPETTEMIDAPELEEFQQAFESVDSPAQNMEATEQPGLMADESKAGRQRAVLETAFAFYNRKTAYQYDSFSLTWETATLGENRRTDGVSPEDGTLQYPKYTVCSSFICEAVHNALGYRNLPPGLAVTSKLKAAAGTVVGENGLVYSYDCTVSGYMSETEFQNFLDVMEPGDIMVVVHPDNDDNDSNGHAMMYIGDIYDEGGTSTRNNRYLLHSSGTKYNSKNFLVDQVENTAAGEGTVQLATMEKLFGVNGYCTPLRSTTKNLNEDARLVVLRWSDPAFVSPTEYPITAATQTRLANTGLTIDRISSITPFHDVVAGDSVTITLTLTNNSNKDYYKTFSGYNTAYTNLPVSEVLPAGVTLTSQSGFIVSGSNLTANITSLAPGASTTLSYTVQVNSTAACHDLLVFANGSVGNIRSNNITIPVGNDPLPYTDRLSSMVEAGAAFTATGTEFANEFYHKYLNTRLDLPTSADLVAKLCKDVPVYTSTTSLRQRTLSQLKTESELLPENKYLTDMLVPDYYGGRYLRTGTVMETMPSLDYDPMDANLNRIQDFDDRYLEPGDVLLYVGDIDTWLYSNNGITPPEGTVNALQTNVCVSYIALGGGKLACVENGALVVKNETETDAILTRALGYDLFFLFRPSLRGAQDVCTLGGNAYGSLSAAMNAAPMYPGEAITLISDVNISVENDVASDRFGSSETFLYFIGAGSNIILDLNGHTIATHTAGSEGGSKTKYKYLFGVSAISSLTVKNGALILDHENTAGTGIFWNYGKLALENAQCYGPGFGVMLREAGATLSVTGADSIIASGFTQSGSAPIALFDSSVVGCTINISDGAKLLAGRDASIRLNTGSSATFSSGNATYYSPTNAYTYGTGTLTVAQGAAPQAGTATTFAGTGIKLPSFVTFSVSASATYYPFAASISDTLREAYRELGGGKYYYYNMNSVPGSGLFTALTDNEQSSGATIHVAADFTIANNSLYRSSAACFFEFDEAGGEMTLDLDGHTLTSTGADRTLFSVSAPIADETPQLTVKNGVISSSDSGVSLKALVNSCLIAENLTILMTGNATAVQCVGEMSLVNCYISTTNQACAQASGGTLTLTDSTFVFDVSTGTLPAIDGAGGALQIFGVNEFYLNTVAGEANAWSNLAPEGLTLNADYFVRTETASRPTLKDTTGAARTTTSIQRRLTVFTDSGAAARVGTTLYPRLSAAINAEGGTGRTITVLRDINLAVETPSSSSGDFYVFSFGRGRYTIDLGGHEITGSYTDTGKRGFLQIYGGDASSPVVLTMYDGAITYTNDNNGSIYNLISLSSSDFVEGAEPTLILRNVDITGTNLRCVSTFVGTTMVDGGILTATLPSDYALYASTATYSNTITIQGGAVLQAKGNHAVYASSTENVSLNISNATVSSADPNAALSTDLAAIAVCGQTARGLTEYPSGVYLHTFADSLADAVAIRPSEHADYEIALRHNDTARSLTIPEGTHVSVQSCTLTVGQDSLITLQGEIDCTGTGSVVGAEESSCVYIPSSSGVFNGNTASGAYYYEAGAWVWEDVGISSPAFRQTGFNIIPDGGDWAMCAKYMIPNIFEFVESDSVDKMGALILRADYYTTFEAAQAATVETAVQFYNAELEETTGVYYVYIRNFGVISAKSGFWFVPYIHSGSGYTYGAPLKKSFYDLCTEKQALAANGSAAQNLMRNAILATDKSGGHSSAFNNRLVGLHFDNYLAVNEPSDTVTVTGWTFEPEHISVVLKANASGNWTMTGNVNVSLDRSAYERAGLLIVRGDLVSDSTIDPAVTTVSDLSYTGASTAWHGYIRNFGTKSAVNGFWFIPYYVAGGMKYYGTPQYMNFYNKGLSLLKNAPASTAWTQAMEDAFASMVLAGSDYVKVTQPGKINNEHNAGDPDVGGGDGVSGGI